MSKPVSAEDFLNIRTVTDPRISPNGGRVAFVVKRVDVKKNKYFTNLWLGGVAPRSAKAFTAGDQHDSDPRWSPDGSRILFVSDRQDELPQLYLISTDGGEAERLTDLPDGSIGDLAWSPDGKKAIFTFAPSDERDTKAAAETRKKDNKSTPPREITALRFREEGAGFLPTAKPHIWVVEIATGKAKALTDSVQGEWGGVWSPDGLTIAYVANRTPDPDLQPGYEDIFVIPAAGGTERRIETPSGPVSNLAWSPDSKRIAYFGNVDPDDNWGSRDLRLWSVPVDGGRAACHTAKFDRPMGDYTLADIHAFGAGSAGPVWSSAQTVRFIASDHGRSSLYEVDTHTNEVSTELGGDCVVMGVSASEDGDIVAMVIGTPNAPAEVHVRSGDGVPIRVSKLNDRLVKSLAVQMPEEFWVDNGEGGKTDGWFIKPPGFDPKRRYPLVLEIHGGPHSQYGLSFFHEAQFLAAQGFVVVFANPRGSKGYGEEWLRALRGKWGEPDFVDLMAVVDYVVSLGFVDEKRMAVTGGSYGGFMTGWVVGHTDRFACAISDRGVYNLVSMAGTCDFPWDHLYFGGHQWEWAENLRKHSPLTYAARVTTPLMILHSEGDLRCPIEQAEQYYAALRKMGKTVKFLRFPGESNHGLSRGGPPDLRLARLEANLAWFKQWLMP